MNKLIRIGTRDSPLALWQASGIEQKIKNHGYETVIVPVVSSGDKNLHQPLYAMGITGVFTRDLDVALLAKEIDLAVHSLKDIPTILPKGIVISSVSERDYWQDILVRNSRAMDKSLSELSIATSSLRRKSFWLNRFPDTEFSNIRGNIQTRLEKLESGISDATILSLAGIKRMTMEVDYEELTFMLPAPAQGITACTILEENIRIAEILLSINHQPTQVCATIERDFLHTLEGGCTAPIGALAQFLEGKVKFRGRLCSLNGRDILEIEDIFEIENSENKGRLLAKKLLESGGERIMKEIRKAL